MRVLFIASEIFPMAKTGGLGDVAAALPVALRAAGVDVRLLMPAYPSALAAVTDVAEVHSLGNVQGWGNSELLLGSTPDSGLPIYLVRNQYLFERGGGPYHDVHGHAWPDNAERFALLCAAAAAAAADRTLPWLPDLVHVNDWHTALVPALIKARTGAPIASVLTIHNAVYQERVNPTQVQRFGVAGSNRELHGVPPSFLSIGIADADYLTTVSPTYAAEIQTPAFGCGLDALLAARAARLEGILNGIDVAVWNPATDAHLAARYDRHDPGGKLVCKQALLSAMKLALPVERPLLACVSRLTWQKGLDVLLACLPELLHSGIGFVLLGTGEAPLEAGFNALARDFPASMVARIAYDEALAHRIIAGADMYVMPSRFEPCGLNQMYSQRYGTVPIVHAVGGLADTVNDAGSSRDPQKATGFCVTALTQPDLAAAIETAARCYRDRDVWRELQRNGMSQDFSWARSAQAYLHLYTRALQ